MQNKFLKDKAPDITAVIMIVLSVFLLFRGLLKGEIIATNDIGTNDLLYFSFPIRFLFSEALKAGEILQWTPHIFSGYPVFAEGLNGFMYPLNLVTCYLMSPIQALNWFILFHVIIAGIGVYYFVKLISGNGWNSIPAAVAISICGTFTTGHTRHINILAIAALAPFLFLYAESYIRKLKFSSAMLYGTIIGLMLLTNHPQFTFICGFISILYIFLRFYFSENKFPEYSKKILWFLLISIGISLLIGFGQLKDTIELTSFSAHSQKDLSSEFTGIGSLPWDGLATFIYPYYYGNAGNTTFKFQEPYLFWEYFHYISIVLLIIAIIAIIKSIKTNNYIKIFLIIGVLSFLFALGDNLQLYKIFSPFPFIGSFRFPVRWLFGTELALIFISPFGIKIIIDRFTKAGKTIQLKGKTKQPPQSDFKKLIELKPYLPGLIISLLVLIDIYSITGKGVVTADPEIFFPKDNQIINSIDRNTRIFSMGDVELNTSIYQRSKGWEGDLSLYKISAFMLPPNIGSLYKINSVGGYTNLCPHYIYEVWGDKDHPGVIRKVAASRDGKSLIIQPHFIKIAKMWGVKDFLSYFKLPEPFILKSDSLGVKHYELSGVFPRAWVVKDIISVPSENKLSADFLLDNNFNPFEKAIVNGDKPPLPQGSDTSKAEILEVKNHSMKIKTLSAGLLVVSDSWYPKWKARVDGQDAKVYRVNNSMRGIISPRSGAEVELYYDEGNIKLFLILSLLTFVVVYAYGTIEYFRNLKNGD